MKKSLKLAAAASVMAVLLTGVTYAATRPVPANQPEVALQKSAPDSDLPGDGKALEQALQAGGPVKYKVLVVDSTEGEDPTQYLDRVAEQWGQPTDNNLLLLIYPEGNYDIRFYMGPVFRAHDVSVAEMLKLVRTRYLPKARQKDAAGGLADLIGAVNQRLGGVAAQTSAPPTAQAPVQSPGTAQAPVQEKAPAQEKAPPAAQAPARQAPAKQPPASSQPAAKDETPATAQAVAKAKVAIAQGEIARTLLTAYLNQYKTENVPEAHRLKEFRFDLSNLTPVESADSRIRFQVKFDVLPAAGDASAWLAGNGQQDGQGWMIGNTVFMTAVKQGAAWKLEGFTSER